MDLPAAPPSLHLGQSSADPHPPSGPVLHEVPPAGFIDSFFDAEEPIPPPPPDTAPGIDSFFNLPEPSIAPGGAPAVPPIDTFFNPPDPYQTAAPTHPPGDSFFNATDAFHVGADAEQAVWTDAYSEFSGSDDDDTSQDSQSDNSSSGTDPDTNADPTPQASDAQLRAIVENLLKQGIKGPGVLRILASDHGVHWSASTLGRRRKQWNIRRQDLPAALPPPPMCPPIRACLVSCHKNGLQLREIQARLTMDTGRDLSTRTILRYLRQLNLKLRVDDHRSGKVTLEAVREAIQHAREFLCKDTGYRAMQRCLRITYHIRVPRQLVYDILREQDPDGFDRRLARGCERRVFRTHGPNHIWSCDGHDKFAPFGIRIYGFVDAWSRRIMSLSAHVTNKDPRHVAWWYLQLAKKHGGIPLLITTDRGTETITIGELQMFLSHRYGNLTLAEAKRCMHWTKSTHNQRIECLWSQLMRRHNRPIIDNIYTALEDGTYNDQDPIQKLLFLFLWVPLLQRSLDIWTKEYNHSRRRRDKRISVPTGCSADFAYTTPHYFHSEDQLRKVPSSHLDAILAEDFPDSAQMFTHTPRWFSPVASGVMTSMGVRQEQITVGNVWRVFLTMLPQVTELCSDIPELAVAWSDTSSSSSISSVSSSQSSSE